MAYTFSDEFIHDEEVSHIVLVVATLFDSNASSSYQEANIEEPSFSVSLEVEYIYPSSCDVDDEKEVTYGVDIDIDPFTHPVFSIPSILDSEIYVPYLSHFVHTSLINGSQPSDFLDVFFARSSLICVIPLTMLDLM